MAAKKKRLGPSQKAMNDFEKRFTKVFGETSLIRGVEDVEYEVISTGSLELDLKLGVGGFLVGSLNEIWGPDGVGKTTIALLTAVEAQRQYPDKMVGWVDMEYAVDNPWVDAHGVDRERWYHYQPESAEDVADAIKEMADSGLFSLIVLDSIGAMIPEVEKEKDAEQSAMGKQAGIITRMVKVINVKAHRTNTTVLMINQVRANLGYGADTTTGGGFALKHVTTHKLKCRRSGPPKKMKIDGEEVEVGHELAIKIERNRVAPPGKTANIALFNQATEKYGPIGIDRTMEAFEVGARMKIIGREGAYYTLPVTGERLQGRDAAIEAMRSSPEVVDEIRRQALERQKGLVHEETDDGADAEPDDDTPAGDKKPKFRTSGSIDAADDGEMSSALAKSMQDRIAEGEL